MAETKYGKYFTTYEVPPEEAAKHWFGHTAVTRLDSSVFEGCNFYWAHWYLPHDKPLGPGRPHIHRDAELLMWFGSNPDDPLDLGAELEMCMGPEMEKHLITKSTVVFIPPYFIHCPWTPIRTWRPWLLIEVHQGPVHTEKSMRQLLSREAREELQRLNRVPPDEW